MFKFDHLDDVPPGLGGPFIVRANMGGGLAAGALDLGSGSGRSGRSLATTKRPAPAASTSKASRGKEAQRRLGEVLARSPGPTGTAGRFVSVRDRSEDDPRRGFRSFAEFLGAVRRAGQPWAAVADHRLAALFQVNGGPLHGDSWLQPSGFMAAPTGFMSGGGAAGEAYLIPERWNEEILQTIYGEDDLASRVYGEVTGASEVRQPLEGSAPWESLGVQVVWKGEGEQLTPTPPITRQALMELQPAYAFFTATEELVADSGRFAQRVRRGVGLAFQWTLSESYMHGTGVARPLGWTRAPACIEVAKEGGQAADTITTNNVTAMHARRLLTPRARWTWLTSSTAIPALLDLQTATGNPMFRQGDGREGEPEGAMLGIPVLITEHCPVLGDAGDLQLVNLPGYYAPRREEGIRSETSVHVFFDYVLEAFRFMVRTNGAPFLSGPVSPARGSDTISHFITLAERA